MQSAFQLNKYYIAEVYGDFSTSPSQISLPIAHHKFNPDRMVVIKQESDIQKAK
jgi:23S rRNA-/tRNA-specific pseudouridylate synthase